ncbi:HD domain-containing protein [Taylorella equigenitalis]|uniref:HD domain-containing protein n=1 Tax=Taylorella equigenitalis TaxID=29575 RepID=UPI00041BE530|nr:HD domain-containing protein [Taylorella equigenitalis]WDU45995.1 HD domain-containing protein [Taylorella equigenitalis]WDU48990.1 HD domain-containing protein [Taylorella equigenitalis]
MGELVKKARDLAYKLHSNQVDISGAPYVNHLKFVAQQLLDYSEIVQAVAWLHDSVEDTDITIEEISDMFGTEVAQAVEAITKRHKEKYKDYITRVKNNNIARVVKLADLEHNMDLGRLKVITDSDLRRLQKYKFARQFLLS